MCWCGVWRAKPSIVLGASGAVECMVQSLIASHKSRFGCCCCVVCDSEPVIRLIYFYGNGNLYV